MMHVRRSVTVRNTTPADFAGIATLCSKVYAESPAWSEQQLTSHLGFFPHGQFVAIDDASGIVVGMAASLIVQWDEYDVATSWRDFTETGTFENHDPVFGRTLYGAEVMVNPDMQGSGVGTLLYNARRDLAVRSQLLRIRAGARLRGYHHVADRMSASEYVELVVNGELRDPTLSFQLRRGFHVLDIVSGYLRHDHESLGYAAVIEWINETVARPEDYNHGRPNFRRASDNTPSH
ncbi:MAG: GNAT family N-acetyltransferase [Gemmatimonadota bacterium]|nr:GNAT family N-acetyltransferase [Gemmatimonadota bacterium]